MTDTGAPAAAARMLWPTFGVLKKPPWPSSRSTATCSPARMSRPIFKVARADRSCVRIRLGKLSSPSGERASSSRPSSMLVMGSPDR